MEIKIGNRVFQGEGVELARKVVNHKIPNKAKTFAIIGYDDEGGKIFNAAVEADELPLALNEIWDMLQPEEELDCENCIYKDECPVAEILHISIDFEDLFNN